MCISNLPAMLTGSLIFLCLQTSCFIYRCLAQELTSPEHQIVEATAFGWMEGRVC